MEVQFERKALYEEVWTMPLTKLGAKYGLSDNGMRKVCKAMNIPLPSAGHWAKVEAGQDTVREELPEEVERTTFISRPPPAKNPMFNRPEDAMWLQERIAFDANPANEFAVELSPTKWHRAILPLKQDILSRAKDYEHAQAAYAVYRAKREKLVHPGADWQVLAFQTAQMPNDSRKSECLRVSIATYRRALAVANAILFAATLRGFEVEVNMVEGRIFLSSDGGEVGFSIRERHPRDGSPVKLALAIDRGAHFEIHEGGETQQLETKLDEFFLRLYPAIVRARVNARENAEKQRVWAIQRKAYEELTRQREQEAKDKAIELERRKALLIEAESWRQAQDIRSYVAHVSSAPGADVPAVAEWSNWALSVAEDLDPAKRKIPVAAPLREFPRSDANPAPTDN